MSINRYNYQEFFLLYIDNELTVAEKEAVDQYVQQNPDLRNELEMLQRSILKPDAEAIFEDKELLLRFEDAADFIYPGNFGEFAVSYADDELNEAEKKRLEAFVRNNPDFQEEFDLIQGLKLTPDHSIVFPDKQQLYRYEKERKPVVIPWWSMAAAAIILLSLGLLWLNKYSSPSSPDMANVEKAVPSKMPDAAIAKTSEKGQIKKVTIQPGTFLDTPDKKDKNVAVADQTSSQGRTAVPTARKVIKPASNFREIKTNGDPANTNNVVANSPDKQRSPQSALLGNKSQTSTENTTEKIAALDESIERTHKQVPDQPAIIVNAADNSDYRLAAALEDADPDENVSVSGIPLDKKNPLRGIIRKASRFIDKNTASRTSKKSGLLIGNIEIAFQ